MADKTTTKFPTMGEEAAHANALVGSPDHTMMVPKGHSKPGVEPSATGNRQGTWERNGFKGAPQMNHVYASAPEAAQTGRNLRIMPSAVGNRDFYLRRQYGQNT